MKKNISLIVYILIQTSLFSFSQKYYDEFNFRNDSYVPITIEYNLSKIVKINELGFEIDLGEFTIYSSRIGWIPYLGIEKIEPGENSDFTFFSYGHNKFYKMGWFARFLLITGKLVVKDDEGKVLLNLDTITPEDFEVTEENGITTATLVIRDKN